MAPRKRGGRTKAPTSASKRGKKAVARGRATPASAGARARRTRARARRTHTAFGAALGTTIVAIPTAPLLPVAPPPPLVVPIVVPRSTTIGALTATIPGGAAHPAMDPRLQWKVATARRRRARSGSAATGPDDLAVIAKVSNVAAFEAMSEVRLGAVIGAADADGYTIATARIPVARAEFIRQQPFVKSLKAAQRVHRALSATTLETEAEPSAVPPKSDPDGGAGAIVGIVDFGCDFAHQNFRDAKGKTRLLGIWDQNADPTDASPRGYGQFYDRDTINEALAAADPYKKLGYGPDPREKTGTHGTHVTDIAAGNGRGTKVPGMAPAADLLFVEVAASDVPWEGPDVVGKSFGDSVQLLEAVQFIFERAGKRPCVVNLSLGTNGGPHDGSTLVEQGLDRLMTQQPNRAVVIAASNAFADGIHAVGAVAAGGSTELFWDVAADDQTDNEIELWYAGKDRFVAELLAPDGSVAARVEPGSTRTLTLDGRLVGLVANRLADPNNGDNVIGVFLDPRMPAGTWGLRLTGTHVEDGTFHAWIERDDEGQSSFPEPRDNSQTIGSVSCGRQTIVVGSYDAHAKKTPLSWFSSAGPTRDGREKPEVSAPGHEVIAARSRSGNGTTRMSGTSMASPAVTGMIALVFGAALRAKRTLSASQVRQIVTTSARRNPPAKTAWDPRYGLGRVSARAALTALAALP